jgi:hypothetical protein
MEESSATGLRDGCSQTLSRVFTWVQGEPAGKEKPQVAAAAVRELPRACRRLILWTSGGWE